MAFERREPFKVEYRLLRHDGEYRWVLDTGRPQLAADGSLTGYIGSCVDISDLKHAQTELAHTTERLRLALKSGKSLAWEWDLTSGRDTCFGDLQTILGMVDSSYVGRIDDFRRGLHPDDQERVLKAIDEAERHGVTYEEEFRVRWQDGTVRWVAAKGRFHYSADGQATRMLGIATDITERKQAEESLRRKESELTEAQRLAAIGSWQWNAATDEVIWSDELFRIAGLEPGSPAALAEQSSAPVPAGTLGTDCALRRRGDALRHAVRARCRDDQRRFTPVGHGARRSAARRRRPDYRASRNRPGHHGTQAA